MADTLAEIQERHEAVKELERSLLDLHQIFLDMAVLVEAQGEMLDNIEAQARAPAPRSLRFSRLKHSHFCDLDAVWFHCNSGRSTS